MPVTELAAYPLTAIGDIRVEGQSQPQIAFLTTGFYPSMFSTEQLRTDSYNYIIVKGICMSRVNSKSPDTGISCDCVDAELPDEQQS